MNVLFVLAIGFCLIVGQPLAAAALLIAALALSAGGRPQGR